MSFNDANLSVCTLPTSTVPVASIGNIMHFMNSDIKLFPLCYIRQIMSSLCTAYGIIFVHQAFAPLQWFHSQAIMWTQYNKTLVRIHSRSQFH